MCVMQSVSANSFNCLLSSKGRGGNTSCHYVVIFSVHQAWKGVNSIWLPSSFQLLCQWIGHVESTHVCFRYAKKSPKVPHRRVFSNSRCRSCAHPSLGSTTQLSGVNWTCLALFDQQLILLILSHADTLHTGEASPMCLILTSLYLPFQPLF